MATYRADDGHPEPVVIVDAAYKEKHCCCRTVEKISSKRSKIFKTKFFDGKKSSVVGNCSQSYLLKLKNHNKFQKWLKTTPSIKLLRKSATYDTKNKLFVPVIVKDIVRLPLSLRCCTLLWGKYDGVSLTCHWRVIDVPLTCHGRVIVDYCDEVLCNDTNLNGKCPHPAIAVKMRGPETQYLHWLHATFKEAWMYLKWKHKCIWNGSVLVKKM